MKLPTIVMIGCFDTKAEDFGYLYTCLKQREIEVMAINTGVLGTTERFPVAIEAEQVAMAGGSTLSTLRTNKDRGRAIEVMGSGAAEVMKDLFAANDIKGIIGMGGGGGTYIALAAMQGVPFGIPKLCLSTLATKDLSEKIGNKDILLMPSIVDVAGLNAISRVLIRQAAGALSGMIDAPGAVAHKSLGSIAMSVFGNTQACADSCSELLKQREYDVMAFHAVGSGGKTMEALASEGLFDGILDLTTTELADELCGGICSAGPKRLTAASERGIPQVVAPGCLDMVNFGAMDTVPEKYKVRQLYSWAPDVTLMRTNKDENRLLGETIAKKLNFSKGPVTVLLPLGGLSKIGAIGEAFHDSETDQVLFESLKAHLDKKFKVLEVQANINTPEFAQQGVKSLMDLMEN